MVETVTFTMHLDKDLHRRLKSCVALRGITMKDFLNNVIVDTIANDNDEYNSNFEKDLLESAKYRDNYKIFSNPNELTKYLNS